MPDAYKNNKYTLAAIILSSTLVTFLLFFWQGHKGFSLWDEGYLWYGAQRVLDGEVPKLDFKAYDPGRYYWAAAIMEILGGNGIIELRVAVAIFQAIGVFAGLTLISRARTKPELAYLLLSTLVLVTWMLPRHKLFDISLSLILILTLSFLIAKPSNSRFLLTGITIGATAVFGRNHGLYGLLAFIGITAWLQIGNKLSTDIFKKAYHFAAGILIGYSPILLMLALAPEFFGAFSENLAHQIGRGSSNLTLPIPWPWTINYDSLHLGNSIRELLVGILFIGVFLFGLCGVLFSIKQKVRGQAVPPAFVASAFLATPYAHYAFSRADINHLAQGIFPLLIGILVVLSTKNHKLKWPLSIMLLSASIWVVYPLHPGWQCRANNQCLSVEISGSKVLVDPRTANDIALIRRLNNQYAANGQSFIVTPFWPGAYALTGKRSPVWDIYALWPRDQNFESKEIHRIIASQPGFALIIDLPLDGRDELRFKNTHPLTYQYILDNFDPVLGSATPVYQIYKARNFGL